MDLYTTAHQAFERLYGTPAHHHFQAPGRVNLIGEHTDYNDGFVLPAAIDYHTCIVGNPREDRVVNLVALDLNEARSSFHLDEPIEHDAAAPWSDYLRGVCDVLRQAGYQLCGADLLITGNVPQGAGLSSSASLEVVTARAMTQLAGETLSGTQAALFSQQAENQFVGCQCGIMDQLEQAKNGMDPVTYRRARHIITENERTLSAADALAQSDWPRISKLMSASHASMRDDFEITVPPIDGLVAMIADLIGDQGGVRMTGGGFGGCVVSLVHEHQVESVIERVNQRYEAEFGIKPTVYVCHPVDGAYPD